MGTIKEVKAHTKWSLLKKNSPLSISLNWIFNIYVAWIKYAPCINGFIAREILNEVISNLKWLGTQHVDLHTWHLKGVIQDHEIVTQFVRIGKISWKVPLWYVQLFMNFELLFYKLVFSSLLYKGGLQSI
jgi:hypothetical protein